MCYECAGLKTWSKQTFKTQNLLLQKWKPGNKQVTSLAHSKESSVLYLILNLTSLCHWNCFEVAKQYTSWTLCGHEDWSYAQCNGLKSYIKYTSVNYSMILDFNSSNLKTHTNYICSPIFKSLLELCISLDPFYWTANQY